MEIECARCGDTFVNEWSNGIRIYEVEFNNNWVCNHCDGCIAD